MRRLKFEFGSIAEIVTHKNCADGMASAIIAKRGFSYHGLNPEITFVTYNTPEHDNLEAHEGMLFIDMTPPRARHLEFVAKNAYVLDHHLHAKDIVDSFNGEHGYYSKTESGALLAYNELIDDDDFYNARYSQLASLASIRDTWQKDHPGWTLACHQSSALLFFPEKYWLDRVSSNLCPGEFELTVGRIEFERRMNKADKIAEKLNEHDDVKRKLKWGFFNDGENLISDVAEAARVKHGFDVVVGYKFVGADVIVSMRSNDKFDVGQYSKDRGGGGHARAAGFSLKDDAPAEEIFNTLEMSIK